MITAKQEMFVDELNKQYKEGTILTLKDLLEFKESLPKNKYPSVYFYIKKDSPFRVKRGKYIVLKSDLKNKDRHINNLIQHKGDIQSPDDIKQKTLAEVLEILGVKIN